MDVVVVGATDSAAPDTVVSGSVCVVSAGLLLPNGMAVLNQLLLPIPPVFVGSLVSCDGTDTPPLEVVVVGVGSEMSGLPLAAVVSAAVVEDMVGSLLVGAVADDVAVVSG